MRKTQVSVSDELKDFCPLTTWQRLKMYGGQIIPFLLAAIAATALFCGIVSVIHSLYSVALVVGLIAFCAIVLCVRAFADKKSLANVRGHIHQRNEDGRWMIYVVNAANQPHAIFGPLTEAARYELFKTLHVGEGLHFVVSLSEREEGFIFVGKRNPHPRLGDEAFDTIQRELLWWKVLPVKLTCELSNFDETCIALKDKNGEVSPGLPILVAAQFIRSAPIGWLGDEYNNWPMALKAMMDRQARQREENVKLAEALDQAIEVSIRAASRLNSDGLTFLSPCEMIAARRPIVELLDRLLPPDDRRRVGVDFPPKPLPDIEPAANTPPSPDGAPPASSDDGHCCCSGP